MVGEAGVEFASNIGHRNGQIVLANLGVHPQGTGLLALMIVNDRKPCHSIQFLQIDYCQHLRLEIDGIYFQISSNIFAASRDIKRNFTDVIFVPIFPAHLIAL
jgi:hypothetical protein